MKTFNFTISCDLASAIINDDFTGVTDDDKRAIEAWYEKHNIGWINMVDEPEVLHGTQCDITGLWSDCVDVIAYESVRYDMTPCNKQATNGVSMSKVRSKHNDLLNYFLYDEKYLSKKYVSKCKKLFKELDKKQHN